jgi:hypothetical protein
MTSLTTWLLLLGGPLAILGGWCVANFGRKGL